MTDQSVIVKAISAKAIVRSCSPSGSEK